MGFEITWVGDRQRDWGEDMRGYKVALRDPNGAEHRKVDLSRKRDSEGPKVGDVLTGTLSPHPKGWEGVEIFREGSEDSIETSTGTPSSTSKDRSILRQVSGKIAARLTSALVESGAVKSRDEAMATFASLIDEVYSVVTEESTEKKAETTKGADDDIPF